MKYFFSALLMGFSLIAFTQKIPFQGKLTEDDEPVTGTKTFVFSIEAASWSETHEDVSVLDGFYSVILGETTSIPESLFNDSDEVILGISVDDVALTSITLYKPIPATADSLVTDDIRILNPDGGLRANLNYYASNDAGSLVLYGKNDSTNVIIGSSYGGYSGYLALYDSMRNQGARLFTNNKGIGNLYTYDANHNVSGWFGNQGGTGGFMQLAGYDADGVYTGAAYTGLASWNNGLPYFIMEGSSSDPYTTLLEFGGNTNSIGEGSYFNMTSSTRALASKSAAISLYIANDPDGSDPNGEAGEIFLYGDETPNFQIGGSTWEDSDFAHFNMFGTKTDGGSWYMTNLNLATFASGNFDGAALSLYSSLDGYAFQTVYLTSIGAAGSGQLLLKDSTGVDVVDLKNNGTSGEIAVFSTDETEKVIMNAYSVAGGLDPYTRGYVLNMDQTGGPLLQMYANGTNTIHLNGDAGTIDVTGSVTASGVTLTSDRRYKKDIQSLDGALENVRKLEGKSYHWKDESRGTDWQIGLIAQEVEEVYPEFVHTNAEGYKSVNYSQMVAVLIEAIKELDAKVASLETENVNLKAELESARLGQTDLDHLKEEVAFIKQILSLKIESSETSSVGQNK